MIFYRNLTYQPPEKVEARQVVTLVEKLKLAKDGHSSPCITRIRWQLDNAAITTPGFLMKMEQVSEIEENHDGTTTYRTWVVFAGALAKIIRKKSEQAWKERIQEWCQDLKKRSESKVKHHEKDDHGGHGKSEGGQPVDDTQ
jgi:hypothetical protein